MSFRTIPNDRLVDGAKLDLISITQPKNLDDVVTNADLSNKVDKTTTVNSKPLSSNVVLTTDDVPEGSTNKYDQVVALTEGTNVTITGTYPNFTINSTGGSGGGQVDSVVGGTNISVDSTDPTAPIVSLSLGADENFVTDAEKAVIGNTSGTNTGDNATNSQYSGLAASKQDTLVSGTNIKTINGQSVLGAGDIEITSGGGGGFAPVYLTNLTSSTVPAYKQISYTPDVAETIVGTVTNNNEVLAQSYIYDGDIGVTTINAGSWVFDMYAYVSSAVGVTKLRIETFKRTSGGAETTLFSIDSGEINNTTRALHQFTTTQGTFSCNTTDRLGTRVYVNTTAVINITASFVVGDGNASFFTTPLQLRASQVRNTPSGNISSTDVQGALNELDSEKAPIASPTFTGTATFDTIKITGGTPGLGKVLTSDADGDATWTTPTGGGSTPDYLLLGFGIL